MREIFLAVAMTSFALTLSACSESTEENAEATAKSMAADTESNLEELGTEIELLADDAANKVDQATAEAEADLEGEKVTEAQMD